MNPEPRDIHAAVSYESSQNRILELERELAKAKAEIDQLKKSKDDTKSQLAELFRLRTIADILPSRLLHIDNDMIVQYANQSCRAISLIPFENIIGSHLCEVVGTEVYNQLQERYDRVLRGEEFQFEFTITNKATNGEERISFAQYVPEWQNGTVVGFYSMGTDITDLRSAQSQLISTSKRLKIVADNLPALISYVDSDLTFQYANKYYEKIFGLKSEDMVGRTLLNVFGSAHIEYSKYQYDLALGGKEVHFEKEIEAVGNRPHLSIDLTLLPDINKGQVLGFYVLGVNQTEIKKAQIEKQRGYDLLQALIDNIPGWVAYIDTDYRYHFANSHYQKISTTPLDLINGKTALEVLDEQMFSFIKPHFDHTLAGNVSSFEFEKQMLDGEIRHILSNYFPNIVEDKVQGAFIYALDMTDQKRLQLELEEAVHQLTLLQDAMPVSTSVFDRDMRYVKANQKHLDLLELPEEEVIGKHLSEVLLIPGNFEFIEQHIKKVLKGETAFYYLDGVLNGGYPLRLQVQIAPIISNNEVVGFQSIEVDITELFMAKKDIRDHNAIFNAVSSVAPIGIFKTNKQGLNTWVNERAAKIMGLTAEECMGLGWQKHLHPEDKEWIVTNWDQSQAQNKYIRTENRFQHSDGKIVWVIGETRPVYTQNGAPDGHIGILFDITEMREASNEISELNQELIATNASLEKRVARRTHSLNQMNIDLTRTVEELDQFAHIAAHDLKEPLRGLQNYASMLKDDHSDLLNDQGVILIESMQKLALESESLLNDLRAYSRIGRKREAVRDIDLNEILNRAISILSSFIAENDSQIMKTNDLPIVHFQQSQALTILQNLISNGIKYNTAENKIINIGQVTSQNFPEIDISIGPTIFVQDNGIGISKKHQETVFQMFKRLHPKTRFGGGTGAGLALVRKIVEFNQGKVWFNSSKGKGSTFFVQFSKPQAKTK